MISVVIYIIIGLFILFLVKKTESYSKRDEFSIAILTPPPGSDNIYDAGFGFGFSSGCGDGNGGGNGYGYGYGYGDGTGEG